MIFEEKIIRLSVDLNSEEQCREYKHLLLEKLKKNYEKRAFEKYGIINKVYEISDIYYEEMMKTIPNIFFLIDTLVETYFPKKGDVINIEINKILTCGIYLEKECFRILIPSLPESYKLKKDKELYFYDEIKKKEYRIGDRIEFEISDVRFERTGFHCLGKIKED